MRNLTKGSKFFVIISIICILIGAISAIVVTVKASGEYEHPIYVSGNPSISKLGSGMYSVECIIKNLTDNPVTIEEINLSIYNADKSADCLEKNVVIQANSEYKLSGVYQITDLNGNILENENSYTDCKVSKCKINGQAFIPATSLDGVKFNQYHYEDYGVSIFFGILGIGILLRLARSGVFRNIRKKQIETKENININLQTNTYNPQNNYNNNVFEDLNKSNKPNNLNDNVFEDFSKTDAKPILSNRDDAYKELSRLKVLLDNGTITQEEFDYKKADLLNRI